MNTCQLCNESLKTVMEMEGDICATCSVKLLPKDMKDSFVSILLAMASGDKNKLTTGVANFVEAYEKNTQ